jgi:6-phospho-beta-glucosidase
VDGNDLWPSILQGYIEHLKKEEDPEFDPETVEALGMLPNYYLHYYYYTERMLKKQDKWPPSRGEEVIEIEKDLLKEYQDPALREPPEDLMKRGGAYYSTVATQLLNAHYNNLGELHVCNVKHGGAVKGWDPSWVLEMPCKVDREGVTPIPADPLPAAQFGLLAHVKAYELLTVEAAVKGDRKALYKALLAHPLGPAADQVKAVMEDLLKTNQKYLPQFA